MSYSFQLIPTVYNMSAKHILHCSEPFGRKRQTYCGKDAGDSHMFIARIDLCNAQEVVITELVHLEMEKACSKVFKDIGNANATHE